MTETKLTFEARVTGAKPVLAKPDRYGGGLNGRLELTLTLDQPKPPREPRVPEPDYRWIERDGGRVGMKPKPGDIQRKKDETDEAYEARDAVVKRKAEQEDWKREANRYAALLKHFEQEKVGYQDSLVAHRGRVLSYVQLVGIASVFGNAPVRVEITPLQQDLLPGFIVGLLSEPQAVAP